MTPRQDFRQVITKELRALVPDATAIIFFGSRVQGLESPTSDYDIMVLAPTGVDLGERERIKKILNSTFPSVTLDLVFGSERWMRANLGREPHLRFWLENGVATYGRIPRFKPYPPFYKDAVEVQVGLIRARMILIEGWSRTQYGAARGYLYLLKELTLIELALKHDYRNEALWREIETSVGSDLLTILRNPRFRHRIRKPMVERMNRLVSKKIKLVRRQLRTLNLPSLEPT
ncbi:MAG TPA: nucleotidyltransferase domain-containing protein [Anaerolineae bacterium]|nr:nucleotidyltransferase domain-containing protein [Anaerolineae bacterium]